MNLRHLSSSEVRSALPNLAGSVKGGRLTKEPSASDRSSSDHRYKVRQYACICGVGGTLDTQAIVCLCCLLLLVVVVITMLTTKGSATH